MNVLAVAIVFGLLSVIGYLVTIAYLWGRAAGYQQAWNQRAADRHAGRPTDPTWIDR